jgi:hypothetical protein
VAAQASSFFHVRIWRRRAAPSRAKFDTNRDPAVLELTRFIAHLSTEFRRGFSGRRPRDGWPMHDRTVQDLIASKAVLHAHWQEVDLVVNMSGFPKERVFEDFDKVEDWPVEDPFGADAETYQRIFDEIKTRIVELAGRLTASAGARITGADPQKAE